MPKKKRIGVVEQRELFIVGCKFINKVRREYCYKFTTLGLDPAISSFGYCLRRNIKVGNIVPKSWGFSRLIHIESEIKALLEKRSPFVILEDYSYNSVYGREKAGELGGIVRRILFFKKLPLLTVAPLSVKAWIKAKKKSQIMLEILDQHGIKIDNEDAADAFLLSDIGHKALLIAKDVTSKRLEGTDILGYLKNEDYQSRNGLKKIYKYQAQLLFRLISSRGKNVKFFSHKNPF